MTAPPALYLPLDGRLRLLLPPLTIGPRPLHYRPTAAETRAWLRQACGSGTRVEFESSPRLVWLVSRRHFRTLLRAVPTAAGPTAVTVDRRARHRCDTRCQNARGDECECQCLGRYHGGGDPGIPWEQVDTRLIGDEVVRMTWTQHPAARTRTSVA